jgi:sulfide:quinone oxidoreductase
VWSFGGASAAAEALRAFDGGRILVLVAGAPYPCPPAPYECAIHVHEHLRARGLRERTELSVATLQPLLMPNAGREGSEWMGRQLAERGISHRVGAKIERVEPGRVVLADGELPFDLLIGIPPHRPPAVVTDSGLTAGHGWIGVDAGTLATSHASVYAVGDVTLIPLANGLPLPKAGVMAELQGTRVARAIAAELRGEEPPAPFDGHGFCPVELGPGSAALVEGNWYAEPEPVVTIAGPSAAYAAEKAAFETEHLERWFGG